MPMSSRCLLEIMKMCSLCRLCCVAQALCPAWPGQVRLTPADPRNYQIAESPNSRGAHFDRIANREALPRDSAQFRQPWSRWAAPSGKLHATAAAHTTGLGRVGVATGDGARPSARGSAPAPCAWRPLRRRGGGSHSGVIKKQL